MNRLIHVQALYVTKLGRTYRSEVKLVNEGQELFDFEQELKYQLAMKDYVIEFTNQHGHKQFVQPGDLETIIAAQIGWEVPTVATMQAEAPAERTEPNVQWTDAEKEMIRKASGGTVVVTADTSEGRITSATKTTEEGVFNLHLPFPKPPVQTVRVKPEPGSDNEETQEIPLPFAGPNAVARTIAEYDPQGPARTTAYGTLKVKLGTGTDPVAPTP